MRVGEGHRRGAGIFSAGTTARLRAPFERDPKCSDGHVVVEGHVALLLVVIEVSLGLGRQLDALDQRQRAQPGPQVDVVVGEAALLGLGLGLGCALGFG